MKLQMLTLALCLIAGSMMAQELIGISGKTIPELSYIAGTIPHSGSPSLIHGNEYLIDDFGDLKFSTWISGC